MKSLNLFLVAATLLISCLSYSKTPYFRTIKGSSSGLHVRRAVPQVRRPAQIQRHRDVLRGRHYRHK